MTHIISEKDANLKKVFNLHGMIGDEGKLEGHHIRLKAFGSISVTQTLRGPSDLKLKCLT